MNKAFLIPVGVLSVAIAVSLIFRTKRTEEKRIPGVKTEDNPDASKRETADEARKRLMADLGRKGAIKSAEVRRAKKAAKEALKNGTVSP